MSYSPGGGSSSINGSSDVALNSPSTNQVLTYDGSLAKWKNANAAVGSSALVTVAASNAPTLIKSRADYVCTGTDDQDTINTALQVNSGSQYYAGVHLSAGTFSISSAILVPSAALLQGSGWVTELKAVSNSATGTGIGTDAAVIKLKDIGSHAVHIRSLSINGNFSAGGTAHGIYFDQTGTTSGMLSTWPDTNPDNYHMIEDIHTNGLSGTGTRHGVYINGSGGNARGNWLSRLSIRGASGYGIYILTSSDNTISDCHVSATTDGFEIAGGSVRLVGNKAFYCDSYGYNITSSRVHMTGCQAQDCGTGINIASANFAVMSAAVDTCQNDGVIINASSGIFQGNIFCRSGGRYATMSRGLTINSGATNNFVEAVIDSTNVTTPLSYNSTAITTVNQASLPSSYYRVVFGGAVVTKG